MLFVHSLRILRINGPDGTLRRTNAALYAGTRSLGNDAGTGRLAIGSVARNLRFITAPIVDLPANPCGKGAQHGLIRPVGTPRGVLADNRMLGHGRRCYRHRLIRNDRIMHPARM